MKFILVTSLFLISLNGIAQNGDTLRQKYHYYYLADLDLRTIAKKMMEGELHPADNYVTFKILDSLTSKNKDTRDFYLPVFNLIISKADGALAEVMGSPVLKYLEEYPDEFSDAIDKKNSSNNFELYSNFAAYELYFSTDYKSEIEELLKKSIEKSKSRSTQQTIEEFLSETSDKIKNI